MVVPKGVTVMVDAGAIFKMRRSAVKCALMLSFGPGIRVCTQFGTL